jgi:hypothetical protein
MGRENGAFTVQCCQFNESCKGVRDHQYVVFIACVRNERSKQIDMNLLVRSRWCPNLSKGVLFSSGFGCKALADLALLDKVRNVFMQIGPPKVLPDTF